MGHLSTGAIHLLCSLHMKRNVKAKLQELSVPDNIQQVVLGDIFGKQVMSERLEGLVDSEDDAEFERGAEVLFKKWKNMDADEHGPMHSFTQWYCQHNKTLLKEKMLKEKRRRAGMGYFLANFTTNASESMNAVLKCRVLSHKISFRVRAIMP